MTKAPSIIEERKNATTTLANSGKRLVFCKAILLMMLSFLAGVFLVNIASVFHSYYPLRSILINILVAFFLALLIAFMWFPLNHGLVKLSCHLEADKDVILTDLFSPYTDANNHRMRHFTCKSALEWAILYGVVHHTFSLSNYKSKWWIFVILAVILECFVFLLFHNRNFYLAYVMTLHPEKSRKELVAMAHRLYLENMFAPILFYLSLLPELVLGALTIGILWILSLFPETPIYYVYFCKTMIKNSTLAHSQEKKESEHV